MVNALAKELWGVDSFEDLGGKIKVTDKEHPWYGVVGVVVAEDVKLSPTVWGIWDKVETLDRKQHFWAKKYQYNKKVK